MKFFFASLALIFLFVHVQSEGRIEKYRRVVKECTDEAEIDDSSVQRIKQGDYSVDNEKSRNYAVCVMRKTQGLTQEDAIDPEALALVAHEEDRPAVRAAAEACKELQGDDVAAKVWNFLACYKEHRPEALKRLESEAAA